MTVHWIDWTIILGFLVLLTGAALATRRYSRSVADFMVANRCAKRYLLTTAHAMSILGAVSIIQEFQIKYEAGFVSQWWGYMLIPIGLFVSLSGWVVYRWRATRILTQAQLFEMRYNKPYRIFVGILAFAGGVWGLGIFPAVAAKFFTGYLDLPGVVHVLGVTVSTYQGIMIGLIVIALVFTFIGGQITVIVTDSMQAIFTMVVFMVLFGFVMFTFDWGTIVEGLRQAPADQSLIHPYQTSQVKDYNLWFYLIYAFNMLFIWPAGGWNQAATCSALNPHESRMSQVLANVRGTIIYTTLLMLPIAAYVVLHHPAFADTAARVTARLAGETEQFERQLRVPMVLAHILPVGLMGAFAAVMLAAFISTNNSYFLQFGGMFVQDCVLPFRKKPFDHATHMWMLRGAVVAVALIVYAISNLFQQLQDISFFFALIWAFVGGAVYIPFFGALYWRRATTGGAWCAAVTGILFSLVAFGLERYPSIPGAGWRGDPGAGTVSWEAHTLYRGGRGYPVAAGATDRPYLVWYKPAEGAAPGGGGYRGVDVPPVVRAGLPDEVAGLEAQAAAGEITLLSDVDVYLVRNQGGKPALQQGALHRAAVGAVSWIPGVFTLNGAQYGFFIYLLCAGMFVIASLLDGRLRRIEPFNLDQLLHRGAYARDEETSAGDRRESNRLYRLLLISREFTRGDKVIYFFLLSWSLISLAIFAVGTLMHYLGSPTTEEGWALYWLIMTWVTYVYACLGTVWLAVGAAINMKDLFRRLRSAQRNDRDDGMVVGHRSLAEVAGADLRPPAANTEEE